MTEPDESWYGELKGDIKHIREVLDRLSTQQDIITRHDEQIKSLRAEMDSLRAKGWWAVAAIILTVFDIVKGFVLTKVH